MPRPAEKIIVCYFVGTNNDWGGASRIIFNVARNLNRDRFEPIVVLTNEGEVCRELRARRIRFVVWKRARSARRLARLRRLAKCLHFYRCNRVDVVHLAYGCLGWKPMELLAARLLRIPVIQHCQAIVQEPCPYTRFSRLVLTCSDYVKQKSAFGPVPVRRLYDIVDVDRFHGGGSARRELGLEESQTVITFLGRKRKRKGLDTFVALARELPENNIRFLVAGQRIGAPNADSYTDDEVQSMLESDSRIRYVGYRPDVQSIYAASDIIVMPSRGEEPCPAVALEAAASGKPLVATDSGAVGELIVQEKSGFVVPKDDFSALVTNVRRLVEEPGLRAEMGRYAMALADERFFREPIGQLEEIYSAESRASLRS